MRRIGFIGAGKMTQAIATGILNSVQKANSMKLVASCPDEDFLKELPAGCRGIRDNLEAVSSSDLVFLAVKPCVVRNVLDEVRPCIKPGTHTVISIAAGVTLKSISEVSSSSGSETGLYLSRASEHNKSTGANRAADINSYTKVLSMILAIQRLGKQRKDFSFERENVAGKSSMRMARLRARGLFGSVQGDFGIGSRKRLPRGTRVIRAMPNITSLALEGTTVYFSNDESEKVDQLIRDTLGLVSPFCERVASEELLDAATAVAGSGPAFVLLVVEALADAAVRSGFARGIAIRIATQTVLGAAALCRHTGLHPALLRDAVTSPGGTTAEGLLALEKFAVRAAFLDAVQKAIKRSNELR